MGRSMVNGASGQIFDLDTYGIEDYELLTMYAKAKGEGAAKALAKSVLDNPQDTSKADEVRRKILLELEKL